MIAEKGNEIGTTTGRGRIVNWLNMDKLIKAINISGTTITIVSKVDILISVKLFKLIYQNKLNSFTNIEDMCNFITNTLSQKCPLLTKVIFSDNPESINI